MQLKTWDFIEVDQGEAYGDITVRSATIICSSCYLDFPSLANGSFSLSSYFKHRSLQEFVSLKIHQVANYLVSCLGVTTARFVIVLSSHGSSVFSVEDPTLGLRACCKTDNGIHSYYCFSCYCTSAFFTFSSSKFDLESAYLCCYQLPRVRIPPIVVD